MQRKREEPANRASMLAPTNGALDLRTTEPSFGGTVYRNCIFCSALLGGNEVLDAFPVGTQVAFDSWKGRLWAVCPRCARWNLAPIEERWEPVEQAEKLFRDAKLRVQTENIGLARLPDGARLIRIGKALPGELAAWRYGAQLLRRRNRYILGAVGVAGFATALAVLPIMGVVGGTASFGYVTYSVIRHSRRMQVLHRLRTPTRGGSLVVRRWHVDRISVSRTNEDDVEVLIRDASARPTILGEEPRYEPNDTATATGTEARALLARGLVHLNRFGASRNGVEWATELLTARGSAEEYVRATVARGFSLGSPGAHPVLNIPDGLALEMALNEESERRALEGDLSALEEAWREAEEIAEIADSLLTPIRLPRGLRH